MSPEGGPDSDAATDAELAALARKGDSRAFTHLMTRHKTWLYRFIRRYVRDGDEAYDLLQESFVAAWGALGRFDTSRSFEAWLRRIALNKCRDRSRRNAVRNAALRLFGLDQASRPADPPPDDTRDEALERLESALARLPLTLREPLILTALEGMSQKDAGALLGISAKAVETRAYRARQKLAEWLGDNPPSGD